MDAGAACATGEVLLFLHADTHLPEDALDHVRVALADPRVVGGNFFLRYVPYTPAGLALTAWGHVRRRLFGTYGGRSAIFARREVFEALDGFGGLPLFEDGVFATRLEAAGRTAYLPTWAETSARRFVGREWAAVGVWIGLGSLNRLGVPAAWLARMYREYRD
jgi:hypothetical protein